MEGGPLLTEEFKEFSKKVVPFLHITTHIQGRKNDGLLSDKGGDGFPYVAFLDAAGEVAGKHQDARDASGFTRTLEKTLRYVAAKQKAAAGDKTAAIDEAILSCELGHIELVDLEEKLQGVELNPEQQKMFDGIKADQTVAELVDDIRTMKGNDASYAMAYEECKKLKAGGVVPSGFLPRIYYWDILKTGAMKNKDAAILEQAIIELTVLFAGNPQAIQSLEPARQALAEMKKG